MSTTSAIARKLRTRDRASYELTSELAPEIVIEPALAGDVVEALSDPRRWVQRRAVDCLAKASEIDASVLQPFRRTLIEATVRATDSKLRWRLAQVVSRLELTARERDRCAESLFAALDDPQIAAVVCAMQALSDFTKDRPQLWPRLYPRLAAFTDHPSPAIRSRANRLLLERDRARRGKRS